MTDERRASDGGAARPTAVVIAHHPGACRSLSGHGIRVVITDNFTPSPSPYAEDGFFQCPAYAPGESDPAWVNAMCDLALRLEGKPVLLSATDWGLHATAEHYPTLSRLYTMATPPPETVQVLLGKTEFAEWANARGIPIPVSHVFRVGEPVDLGRVDLPFPWVIKPGHTFRMVDAEGTKLFLARDRSEAGKQVELCHRYGMDVVIQEDLSKGDTVQWSFAGVCHPAGVIHSAVLALKMRQSPWGVATAVETVPMDSHILEIAEQICRELRYTGIFEIELRADAAGRPRVIEINPRIWNQAELPTAAGLDLVHTAYLAASEDLDGLESGGYDYRPYVGWLNRRRDWKVALRMLQRRQVTLPQLFESYRRAKAFD
jgi:predicted ATP-grasp superfamily ATP-dependent carboligase